MDLIPGSIREYIPKNLFALSCTFGSYWNLYGMPMSAGQGVARDAALELLI